jgi:endonuclease III
VTHEAAVVKVLLDRYGQTYAEQAGIRLADKPAPLYQLQVLSLLMSARIRAEVAVSAASELFGAGCTTPRKMAAASWQDRVDALGRGSYRRYDERTATQLGDGAQLLLDRYGGDLRGMRGEHLSERLQEIPGIGPVGAEIFAREAQGVWPELAPAVGGKVLDGAARLQLPKDRLAELVDRKDLPRFAAALTRVGLDKKAADAVLAAARG